MEYPSAWTYRVALNTLRTTSRRRSRELALAARTAAPDSLAAAVPYPENVFVDSKTGLRRLLSVSGGSTAIDHISF